MNERTPAGFFGRLERFALLAGALTMLAIVAASVLIAGRTGDSLADAAESQAVRALTVDLLEALTLAETGQRGYLLTGKPDYLKPYDQAVIRIPALLAELQRRLGGDPEVAAWRGAIGDKMDELAQTLQLDRGGHHAEALAVVQSDRGQKSMQAALAISSRLATRQRTILAADLQRSQEGTRILVAVDAAAFLILALLVLFVTRSARRSWVSLEATQTALRAANAELEAGSARLERAVEVRTADLTEANAEIQRFAYIVSHDLRAPLLNIIGFTAELEVATSTLNRFVAERLAGRVPAEVREASEEDLPEAIRFIQTSTAKMDRLIGAILRLSREGRRVLAPERLDMAGLLGGVIGSVRHQAEASGAEITLGSLPPITSDRIALEQVFSNLIENALKYGVPDRPGRIHVSGDRHLLWVTYTVRDNGRGILARDLERVFELFRRAGNQDQPGEGIGLAHVRALVRRLGGTIDCQSTFGEGSSFILRLPAEPLAASPTMGGGLHGDDG